jgi:hypothetical protein
MDTLDQVPGNGSGNGGSGSGNGGSGSGNGNSGSGNGGSGSGNGGSGSGNSGSGNGGSGNGGSGNGGSGNGGSGNSGSGSSNSGNGGNGGGANPGVSASGPWVTAHDLSYPNYAPKRLDVSAFIGWAIAEARKADPDAALFRVDVSGVGPDGKADLSLPTLASDHGSLDLRFFSAARAKPDPSVPVGVPQRGKTCEFRIEAEPDGVRLRPLTGFDCKRNVAIPPPRCTATALWKRALASRAPRNAIASLGYRAWSGRFRWGFDIGFGADRAFSTVFDDDC